MSKSSKKLVSIGVTKGLLKISYNVKRILLDMQKFFETLQNLQVL
jgi:hypothetical protein